MGMSLFYDEHEGAWDDVPLTSRGIVPRLTSDYIAAMPTRPGPTLVS
jgi:hypothetical protein